MFKYNESSMVCAFIQNLLRNKYIPTVPIIKDMVVKVKEEDKNIRVEDIENKLPNNTNYIKNNDIYIKTSSNIKYIGNLEFGKKYLNITSNYIPTCNYYSTELHEWLGRYLRAFSDYYKIDLMAFYNCFSNRLLENVGLPITIKEDNNNGNNQINKLEKTKNIKTIAGTDEPSTEGPTTGNNEGITNEEIADWYVMNIINSNTQITCFPIRPNTNYTIKLYGNVSGNIIAQPIYFNGNDFLQIESIVRNQNNVKILPCTGQVTYRYDLDIESENDGDVYTEYEDYIRNQKYLYLILQIPQLIGDLRISVIEESEYFNTLNKTLLNLGGIDYNVPFSDRLLEYLTENVITRIDKIKQNISRVQEIIKSSSFNNRYNEKPIGDIKTGKGIEPVPPYNNIETTDSSYTGVRGIYDDSMRAYIYNSLINKQIVPDNLLMDFNGYVDKDVEQLLMRVVSQDKSLQEKLLEI